MKWISNIYVYFLFSPSISAPQLPLKKEMFMRSFWLSRRSRAALTLSTVRILVPTWPLRTCFSKNTAKYPECIPFWLKTHYSSMTSVLFFPVSSPGSSKAGKSSGVDPERGCSVGCTKAWCSGPAGCSGVKLSLVPGSFYHLLPT